MCPPSVTSRSIQQDWISLLQVSFFCKSRRKEKRKNLVEVNACILSSCKHGNSSPIRRVTAVANLPTCLT